MPRDYGSTGSQQYASAPTVGQAGASYFNTTEGREYVSDGTQWKMTGEGNGPFLAPCRVATNGNITLSGTQTIDGVAVVAGDRVLVGYQTTGSQNGIYVVAAGAWSRAADANSATAMARGTRVRTGPEGGNLQAKEFVQVNTFATLGTDTPVFRPFVAVDQVNAFIYPPPWGQGHTLYDTSSRTIRVWDGVGAWSMANGILQAPSTSRPGTPADGNMLYETDTGYGYIYGSSQWQQIGTNLLAMPTEWPKTPVRLATTAAIGAWPPSGALTIDGFTTANGDRILIKDETTTSRNGIYTAGPGAWSRPADADSAADLSGAVVYVELGSSNLGTYWSTPIVPTAVIGTDAMPWNRVGPEVAVQPAQPTFPFDLWVDTDDTGVWTTGLTYSTIRTTSGTVVNATTPAVVTGTTQTVGVNGPNDVFLCLAYVDCQNASTTASTLVVQLYVGGVAQSPQIINAPGTVSGIRTPASQHWVVTGLAAGSTTFELRANLTATGGSQQLNATHTGLSVIKISG